MRLALSKGLNVPVRLHAAELLASCIADAAGSEALRATSTPLCIRGRSSLDSAAAPHCHNTPAMRKYFLKSCSHADSNDCSLRYVLVPGFAVCKVAPKKLKAADILKHSNSQTAHN